MAHARRRPFSAALTLVSCCLALTGPAAGGVITASKWFAMGPRPLVAYAGATGGRATCVAVNPMNADDVWIGTAGGGVWHSINGGVGWLPTTDDQASPAIGAVALAGCSLNGCTQIYAGTGENSIRRDTYYGQGVLVGTVAGGVLDWKLRNGQPDGYDFSLGSINNVVLDRTTSGSGQVFYITLSSGVTASASESTVTAPQSKKGGYGIYKSSNNGLNWTKLTGPGLPVAGSRPTDLEIDPSNHLVLYAGFLGLGIYKTVDGGANWCPLDPGVPRPGGCAPIKGLPDPTKTTFDHVEIEIARVGNPPAVYATFGLCSDPFIADCTPLVYVSSNQGADWTLQYPSSGVPVKDDACPSAYTRYTHALTAHPTQAGRLFLGGLHLCVSPNSGAIGSWTCADTSTPGFKSCKDGGAILHLDHHQVVFADSDATRAYDVNDGGVAVSTDGGTTWTPRNDLQTIGFQSIATSPKTARVIGGAQDNGGMIFLGWKEWYEMACCGDGGFAIMDRDDVKKVLVTSNAGTLFPTYVLPVRSTDGGINFETSDDINGNHVVFNKGLPNTDPRSFYPPFIQDPTTPHPLYFGTNSLYRSTDFADNWTAVSPVLSADVETEIPGGKDVITAIAVAPGNKNRIYLGYYSGKLFVTDSACTSTSCWSPRSSGLQPAPITWIAVDPGNADKAYVTQSGFFPGVHVFSTTSAGVSWSPTASHPDLNGVPANTIAIEPADTSLLWLGTDHGVYKGSYGGGSWTRFSDGLPNVPVYALVIDVDRGRVIAATHGRGAYILSQPSLNTFGGCVNNVVSDVAVNGLGFFPNQVCTMTIRRLDGSVCAGPGTHDALNGVMATNDEGQLASSKFTFYNKQPVAWACKQGVCLNKPVSDCNQPNNPMSTVIVTCAGQTAYTTVTGCPASNSPPSSWVTILEFAGGLSGASLASSVQPAACYDPALAGGGSFQLQAAVQVGDGTSRVLCTVDVPFSGADTAEMVLENARDAVNADGGCQSAGVSATVLAQRLEPEVEDLFARPGNLALSAPGVTGSQLVPSVRAAPGQSTNVCFDLQKLGSPLSGELRSLRIRFATPPTGALGGSLTLMESSPLGDCGVTVPTLAGESPDGIAAALEAAFQAPDAAGSTPPACPSDRNPRDVVRERDSVITALASRIRVCSNDAGVGVAAAPEELCAVDADCDDGNPCTRDACETASGQCRSTPEPDGLPCDDANACTVGGACFAGLCGTPIDCDDHNSCTADTCDPATGRCASAPIVCDDANPCTADLCNADTGRCVFSPLVGTACDDGDPCTSGDTCVSDRVTGSASCTGTAACDDSNPCTVDRCDPGTGLCSVEPIQCDDGNPCTFDFCEGGTCGSFPVFGSTCDDGDRCTRGDTCVTDPAGLPVCRGGAVDCDDGNPCTVDQCDAVTGGCTHTPASLAEVQGLQFTGNITLTWSATPGASYWNTYRGTIPSRLLGSRPYPPFDQACFESDDTHRDGPLVSNDPADPPLGAAFYYDVTDVTGCGEGPLGAEWDGTVIPNTSPCLVP